MEDPSPLIGGQSSGEEASGKGEEAGGTSAEASGTSTKQSATVGEVAEYIGESLGDLMNRKDALVRQLADVNQRIASAGQAGSRLLQAVPRFIGLGRTKSPAKKTRAAGQKTGNGKRKRPAPPDDPMVAATERARAAEAKGRAAKRARSSRRSGNR